MSYLIWYGITSVLCSCCYALGAIVARRVEDEDAQP